MSKPIYQVSIVGGCIFRGSRHYIIDVSANSKTEVRAYCEKRGWKISGRIYTPEYLAIVTRVRKR